MQAIFNNNYVIELRQALYTYNLNQEDRRLIELVSDLDNNIFNQTRQYLLNNTITNIKVIEEDNTYIEDSETIYPFQITKFYGKDDISMRILFENVNDN